MPGNKPAGDPERFIWHVGEYTIDKVDSQCLKCKNFMGSVPSHCHAFKDSIPGEIFWNRFDHRQPYQGDHGIRWEPLKPGLKHPLDEE